MASATSHARPKQLSSQGVGQAIVTASFSSSGEHAEDWTDSVPSRYLASYTVVTGLSPSSVYRPVETVELWEGPVPAVVAKIHGPRIISTRLPTDRRGTSAEPKHSISCRPRPSNWPIPQHPEGEYTRQDKRSNSRNRRLCPYREGRGPVEGYSGYCFGETGHRMVGGLWSCATFSVSGWGYTGA
jgi:hypothetical protein